MDRKKAGFIAFGIIIFIMYAFGIHTFEAIWSFPSQRAVPLMVLLWLEPEFMHQSNWDSPRSNMFATEST